MPTADEIDVENQIRGKGLIGPRLTPDMIDNMIVREDYHVFPGTTMTVCCLTLRNGFNVIGESASASPENFDANIGRQLAFKKARDRIWALEGYALRNKLAEERGWLAKPLNGGVEPADPLGR